MACVRRKGHIDATSAKSPDLTSNWDCDQESAGEESVDDWAGLGREVTRRVFAACGYVATQPPSGGAQGARRRRAGGRLPPAPEERRYCALAGTIRGSNTNTFGSCASIRALTQWVLRAPKVSTRVKLPSTPPPVV